MPVSVAFTALLQCSQPHQDSTSSFHSSSKLCAAAASSLSHVDLPVAPDWSVARKAAPKLSWPADGERAMRHGFQQQTCNWRQRHLGKQASKCCA